jgi:hypothetical protein
MTEQQQQVKEGGNSPTAKLNNNQSQKFNNATLVITLTFSMFAIGCIIGEVAAGLSQKSE